MNIDYKTKTDILLQDVNDCNMSEAEEEWWLDDETYYLLKCGKLEKKLDIATKALEDIRTAYQFSGACGDGYEMDAIAEKALKEMEEIK